MIVAMAERRVAAVKQRVAAAAGAVPGVRAEITDDGVVLSGRGLVRRAITDPLLHDIAGWGR